jgi:Ca-activated chloride channel family protein
VPDASKITPPVTPPNTRAGHDISIDVVLDAGVPIHNISSKLHEVNVTNVGKDEANVSLKDKETIPNKDFVLSWDVAGDDLKSGYLTYRDSKTESGYFTLMLLPPKRVTVEKIAPKEMIFLIDCSGSQRGAPLEKAKETLRYIVDHMNPQDSFQIIAFANQQKLLFQQPEQVNGQRKVRANKFIDELEANGGTWMGPAVEKACSIAADAHRLRIVTFMTDGYVGNDLEILGMIKKNRATSRWFSFGTGNSVNRTLIDGIATEGGGEADYVLLNTSGAEVGKKFYDRISSPVLTDVSIDFGKLDVKEVYPREVSDVWAEKPLYFKGRYLKPGAGTVTLKGYSAGKPYTQTLPVTFPEINHNNEVLGSIWARAKVDRLQSEDYQGAQSGKINQELKDEIIKTALDHHIITNYTSFVAVEEKTVTKDGVSKTVTVPVEMPEGVDREAIFGDEASKNLMQAGAMMPGAPMSRMSFGGAGRAKHATYVHSAYPMPMMLSGKMMQGSMQNSSINMQALAAPKSTPEEKPSKLDAQLQQLLEAKASGISLPKLKGSNGTFVEVTVELSDSSAAALKKLKDAGFTLKIKKDGALVGKIKIEDLKKLSELSIVKSVKHID